MNARTLVGVKARTFVAAVLTVLAAAVPVVIMGACGAGDERGRVDGGTQAAEAATPPGSGEPAPSAAPGVAPLFRVRNLPSPYSVLFDEELDVWFVSNIGGADALERDGDGFLARLRPESDSVYMLALGGQSGIILDGPKGMEIVAETLWVADIDVVRGFHKVTGAPLATIDMAARGALNLQSITLGPDSALYVTDEGQSRWFRSTPGRIWRISRGRVPSLELESRAISGVRAIAYDRVARRFVLAGSGRDIIAWSRGSDSVFTIGSGPGEHDGIAVMEDGRILFTSRRSSALHVFVDGEIRTLITELEEPGAFAYDLGRGRVAIPISGAGTVEVWQVR